MKSIILRTVVCILFVFSIAITLTASGQEPPFKPAQTAIMLPGEAAQTLKVDLNGADDLYLVATYGNDSYDSDQAIWAEPTLFDAQGNAVRLTTLKPESVKTGWGAISTNKNHAGRPLSIAGQDFSFGFWAHAPSILHFKLGGKYARFETKVGLDTGSERGSSEFQVRGDPAPYPTEAEYKRTPPPPSVPSVAEVEMAFNAEAAKELLDRGIEEILFIRRLTNTGTHIYTEYVDSEWLPGGGLCTLNLKTGKVREIAPELTKDGVVGWFDLSFDGKKIVFDFKKGPDDGYRVYEVDVDGSNLRQLTFPQEDEEELVQKYRNRYHHGTDDMEPCYLPDGGIVFATTRCQFSVLCDSGDGFTVKNLYRMNGDGSGMRPLSYSALSEATPTIMHDGRILYHRWEYVDKAAGNAKSLWAMKPDGSASSEIYGNSISFPETMIQARVLPDDPNKIVMLGASHCCPNNAVGTVIVVDTTKNIRDINAMTYITDDIAAFHHNGFHFKDEKGEWFHDLTGRPGRLFRNPYPLSGSAFLVSHKPKGLPWSASAGYDLSILDEKGRETQLLKDPSVSLWQPFPLTTRPKPMQPISVVEVDEDLAEQGQACCIVTDIYVGMDGVRRGEVKYIRVLEQVPRSWSARKNFGDDSWGTTHAHSAVGNGSLSVKVQHGIVPVEEDGSAHFLVPASKAIYFQALDENFRAIQTERTYVNFNPGETRSCVGCHETPDMAAPRSAAIPKALTRAPSIPSAQPGQTQTQLVFDYDRQIQPIFDKHCVSCHGPENAEGLAGGLDLRGDPQGTYSVSYNALVKLSTTEKQILGYRKYRDEDAAMNGIEYIPPYRSGTLSSPLGAIVHGERKTSMDDAKLNEYTAKLAETHAELELSPTEKLVLTNWLDINCQYHPSYFGWLHAKFQGDSMFRPAITFEEARSRELPERFQPRKQAMNP